MKIFVRDRNVKVDNVFSLSILYTVNNMICFNNPFCFQVHPFYLEPERNFIPPAFVFFFLAVDRSVLFHVLHCVVAVRSCSRF